MNPSSELLHLWLNHIPVVGLALGGLLLLAGLLLSQSVVQRCGLCLILLCSISVFWVFNSGEQAEAAILGLPLDPDAFAWMHEHEERADDALRVYLALIPVCLTALGVWFRFPTWGTAVSTAALTLTLLAMGMNYRVAEAGGKIRRPNLREGPPPSAPAKAVHGTGGSVFDTQMHDHGFGPHSHGPDGTADHSH